MSRHFVPINAVPLKLTAYATSGLPVTYQVLGGSDKISITTDGTYWYINPIQLGYATIVAYQTGSADYAPALPVAKLIKVIGLPEDLSVEAKILTPPADGLTINVNVLEPPVAVSATIDSVPLEPTKVKIEDQTPKAPIFVTLSYTPEAVQNIYAYDYDNRPAGFPNGFPYVQNVSIVTLPEACTQVTANQLVTPKVNYAINLTKKKNIQSIDLEAEIDSDIYDAEDFWDYSNNTLGLVQKRNEYLQVTTRGLYKYNPLWKFKTRPALDITQFYYEDSFNTQYNGKYQRTQLTESPDSYDYRWVQVGANYPYYLDFISVKMHPVIFDTDLLASEDLGIIGHNVFLDLEDKFYVRGHKSQADLNHFMFNEVYPNYVPSVVQYPEEPYDLSKFVMSGYVFSKLSESIKYTNLYYLIPFAGGLSAFKEQYEHTSSRDKYAYFIALDSAKRSLSKMSVNTAGDLMQAYNDWDTELAKNDWHPAYINTPFKETFVNSFTSFGINPYAIVGEGISLTTATLQSTPNNPNNVIIDEG